MQMCSSKTKTTQKKDTIMMIIKKELPSVLAQENWRVTYKP